MWAIAWPFFLAVWLFLFVGFTSFFFGRKAAETGGGAYSVLGRHVRRGVRGVFYLCVGFGGLIVMASAPSWFYWGRLHVRGVPVDARVVSWTREYDAENSRHYTRVTYEFEAEADGQRRPFRREGELRGTHFLEGGHIQVLHDPADPSDSKMSLESIVPRDLLLSLASFLVLGVGSFLLKRRWGAGGAAAAGAGGEIRLPPATPQPPPSRGRGTPR